MSFALAGIFTLFAIATLIAVGLEIALQSTRRDLLFWKTQKKLADKAATAEREELGRLRVQLAGCGVAALGGTSPEHVAKRGQYGWSPSYQDVLELRLEVEALRSARDHAIHLIDIGGYGTAIAALKLTKKVGLMARDPSGGRTDDDVELEAAPAPRCPEAEDDPLEAYFTNKAR